MTRAGVDMTPHDAISPVDARFENASSCRRAKSEEPRVRAHRRLDDCVVRRCVEVTSDALGSVVEDEVHVGDDSPQIVPARPQDSPLGHARQATRVGWRANRDVATGDVAGLKSRRSAQPPPSLRPAHTRRTSPRGRWPYLRCAIRESTRVAGRGVRGHIRVSATTASSESESRTMLVLRSIERGLASDWQNTRHHSKPEKPHRTSQRCECCHGQQHDGRTTLSQQRGIVDAHHQNPAGWK